MKKKYKIKVDNVEIITTEYGACVRFMQGENEIMHSDWMSFERGDTIVIPYGIRHIKRN